MKLTECLNHVPVVTPAFDQSFVSIWSLFDGDDLPNYASLCFLSGEWKTTFGLNCVSVPWKLNQIASALTWFTADDGHCQNREKCLAFLFPLNTRCWPSAGLMLGQRLRRWPNINPALSQRLGFTGSLTLNVECICWFCEHHLFFQNMHFNIWGLYQIYVKYIMFQQPFTWFQWTLWFFIDDLRYFPLTLTPYYPDNYIKQRFTLIQTAPAQ